MEELFVHGGISHNLSIGHDYADGIVSILLQPLHIFALEDEIVSCLWALTSYISHRFIQFVEDFIYNRDVKGTLEDFLVISSCEDPACSYYNNSGSVPSSSSSFSSSLTSNNHSTIPGVHKQETFEECSAVYSRYEIIEKKLICGGIHLILKGLELSKYCVTSSLWLATAPYSFSLYCIRLLQIRVKSTISRVQIALHGSSGDIGWMQHDPNLDPVEDGSTRFLKLLYAIRNGEHKLPDSYLYLLIPGLFSNHGPLYFVSTKRFFSKMGLACHIAKIHSEASVEHNSWVLKQYIEELYWGSGKRVMLLGHSKGGVDAAAALSLYWSELKDKVAGLALLQSPYGGSPIASDIMREGQVADRETRRIIELFLCRIIKGDIRALEDLTYQKRKEFLAQHKLPKEIPLISFHSEANVGPTVITMMSPIAHIELPWLPFPGFRVESDHDALSTMTFKVPVIVPVSAALALSALHLRARYGEKSDGLVTCRDAEVPGSIVVRPNMKLDHAWMVYSTWNKNHSGPDASEMCEALLTMLVELGDCKRPVENAVPILNFDGIA